VADLDELLLLLHSLFSYLFILDHYFPGELSDIAHKLLLFDLVGLYYGIDFISNLLKVASARHVVTLLALQCAKKLKYRSLEYAITLLTPPFLCNLKFSEGFNHLLLRHAQLS
jgi:hypothetical protein